MGSGRWSNDAYTDRLNARAASGRSAFHYSDVSRQSGIYKVHDDLDPQAKAGAASPFAGQIMRESRDSTDHPNSVPIAVFFDVTGSMATYPAALQERLPTLLAHLLQRVQDPQILMGAIGDAKSDRVPLQVAQFESDIRIDEQLGNILLEGGGGGGNHESYELALYFLARHTDHDALNLRGKKGYAFIIGDEQAYPEVAGTEVTKVLGGGIQSNIPTADILAEAQQKYEVYFVSVNNNYRSQNESYWKGLVGDDYYLTLDDPSEIVSLIGDTVVAGEITQTVGSPLSAPKTVSP